MSWTLHQLGASKLPQACARCGQVIIADEKNSLGTAISDPLPSGQPVYVNDREGDWKPDGSVAIDLPWGEKAPACKAG